MKNHFITLFFLLTFSHVLAQGSLPSKKFSYKDYQGSVNVWAFLQDRAGFMYVGLPGSLIQYDGSTWRTAKIKDSTGTYTARYFYEDKDGKVYAFGDGIIGFFTTNEKSELVFKSLLDKLPEKARRFSIGTRIMPMSDGLYFSAVEWLARWNGTEFTVWYAPKTTFTRGFSSHGKIYMRENETGVYEFRDNKFHHVAGSQTIFGQERISFFVPSSNGTSLVGARSKGFFRYNPNEKDSTKRFTPIDTSIDAEVKANNVYDAIQLPNGDLLVNFFTGGVAQFNNEGKFLKWVYQTSEFITTCYIDKTGQLWLGSSQNGIIRLSIDSPYTLWNINELNNQVPNWLYRFKGELYAGGASRLTIYKNGQFVTLKNSPIQPFSSLEVEFEGKKMFLAGGFDGVVQIEGENITPISRGLPVNQIFTHPKFPNRIFVADRGGMHTLLYKNGKWIQEKVLKSFSREGWRPGFRQGTIFFYEESSGYLWGIRLNNEFAIITWDNPQEIDKPNIKLIQSKTKLPINNINFEYEKKLVFQANTVFYTYDTTKRDFIPFNFVKQYAHNTVIRLVQSNKTQDTFYLPVTRQQGQLFVFNRLDVVYKKADGTFVTDSTTHTHLPQVPAFNSFLDGDSIYWISTNENLLQYNLKKNITIPKEFHTYIRQLKTVKEIVCGGTFCSSKDSVAQYRQAEDAFLTFPYENNDITIQYAAPYFIDEDETKFSYYLEGSKRQEWSEWTTETKKEYTNLREGKYTFKVKARNVFGQESDVATYKFVILPPWYRTWWAYLLYVVAGGLAIAGLIYANSRRLIIAKRNLESLVRQRTSEIEKQKDEISAQRDNLVELNEEINQQREEILLTAESLKLANDEVSKKNDDILASINYARRIQFAMLPFEHRVDEFLGKDNFFVLYKPKDIVSGDFYVFEELQDKIFVAVADCTGHGVPGAFMSMIGNQLIHEIIVRDAIQRPDLVLNKLHCEIRRVLQQHESDTQDGMDIALVVIDKKQKSFEYAGAMNSIYYILENTPTEIHEIAADKKPIGGRYFREETERVFTYHTVQLPENEATTIYIFSDGYCDQFGGAENKKYMNRRFKENLLAMQNEPMTNQAAILENNITQWMEQGKEKQIDDILVLGVTIK